jgi:nicotinamide-nucleotide amidase
MNAVIIGVGDEVLYGETVNSNAAFLAKELFQIGYEVLYHIVVADDEQQIASALREACAAADVVITTGGLGPTNDDMTKNVVARTLGLEMYCDERIKTNIEAYFSKRKSGMVQSIARQYLVPVGSTPLLNSTGTAPGLYIVTAGKVVICLPGPPAELNPMFENGARPLLARRTGRQFSIGYYMTCGAGESVLEEAVRRSVDADENFSVNTYLTGSGVMLKAVAKGATKAEADTNLHRRDRAIREAVGDFLYGTQRIEVWEAVARKLIEKHITVTAAESCTGGHFADLLVRNPGISAVFSGSVVAYSNAVKQKLLGVRSETLETYGAVSAQTATEMAEGARELFGTDCAVAITGHAGPDIEEAGKPVGLVYICVNFKGESRAADYIFPQKRVNMQHRSAMAAFKILNEFL